jgi:uncharacterized protein (DUF58 family)
MTDTGRWAGAAGAALLSVGAGVLVGAPGLLVASAVLAGFLAVRAGTDAPEPSLSVDRNIADTAPTPGDEVDVDVTVTNEGASLFDLRLVDGVPDGLAVVEGPARHATALSPGGSATFSYTVRASRGRHEWAPLCAITRDPVGSDERETAVAAGGGLRCVPEFDGATDLPLRGLTTPYAGRVPTDIGGSGVEFYAVREYRRGDPLSRVDWNRAARTDELATLQLREERAATVVVLVDARPAAYVAPGSDSPNAVERSVDAGARLADAMLSAGDRVGAAAFSPLDCWVAPGTGTAHRAELRETFATDAALGPTPPPEPDRGFSPTLWQRTLRRRLPTDAQLLLFSPFVDDAPVRLARRLDAAGHLVTAVSTDPTGGATPGARLSAVERDVRLTRLRSGGVRAVDWPAADPLAVATDRAARRWSR